MILDKIVQDSRLALESRMRVTPLETMRRRAMDKPRALELASVLRGERVKLIAEVKKASPSRGLICLDFDPVVIAKTYAANGAAAISVLTESRYFQGNPDFLREIDGALGSVRPPLLRKDFIYEPYQIFESRALGADALLLIAAILDEEKLRELLNLSHSLHLSCLVEVHNENEVEIALKSGARIIGINNRDLQTFNVDITTTQRLRPLISRDRIVVSESGVKNRGDLEKLRSWGVDAVLVGESLVASRDIGAKMRELL